MHQPENSYFQPIKTKFSTVDFIVDIIERANNNFDQQTRAITDGENPYSRPIIGEI